MKVKMPDGEWKDVGALCATHGISFHTTLSKGGTVFVSEGGVEVFLSAEDMKNLTGPVDPTPRF